MLVYITPFLISVHNNNTTTNSQVHDQQLHGQSPDTITSMHGNLKWLSLELRRWQTLLGVFYKINNSLVDMTPASFFHHSDSRARMAEEHKDWTWKEQAQHHVLFHSFFPCTVDFPLLESTKLQSSQPPASPQPWWTPRRLCNSFNFRLAVLLIVYNCWPWPPFKHISLRDLQHSDWAQSLIGRRNNND